MFSPFIQYVSLPSEQREYDRGFEDAFNSLTPIVKKLGKKFYKEFLLEVKKKENKFYSSYTVSTHPHKCNCEYCELNN